MSNYPTSILNTNFYSEFALISTKPPIQVFGIEGRYAHAVYSAAAREKQLDKVEAELTKVEVL